MNPALFAKGLDESGDYYKLQIADLINPKIQIQKNKFVAFLSPIYRFAVSPVLFVKRLTIQVANRARIKPGISS